MLGQISFVGGGVMAEAIVQGLLSRKLVTPVEITVGEPRKERRDELTGRYGVRATGRNVEAVASSGIIVICVKPQDLHHVLAELKGRLKPEQLIISIVAGARLRTISEGAAHEAVVRVMPNTPAQYGEGMSVWTPTASVTKTQLEETRTILGALGKERFMDEERFLDMATAVSGTGPTYVFLVMEAMIDAAVHLGFPRHIAYELVTETMRGSIIYAMKSAKHPAELRNLVTSPGGTSAAALYQLEKGGLRTVISKAIWAAYERSRTLGERGTVTHGETKQHEA
jgi:pyrroline-5-carboxylate reductase